MRVELLSTVLVLAGCGSRLPPTPQPATPSPETRGAMVDMADHAKRAEELRYALVAGDLTTVRETASELERMPPPEGLPGDWVVPYVDMKTAALELAAAQSHGQAGAGMAQLAQSCAGCHSPAAGGPDLEVAYKARAVRVMPRHAWAVDFLWLGVAATSHGAYHAGAAELASSPLLANKRPEDPAAAEWADRLAFASTGAVLAESVEQRAHALGSVLGVCGGCHAATLASM